jgi:hypothetical protein
VHRTLRSGSNNFWLSAWLDNQGRELEALK